MVEDDVQMEQIFARKTKVTTRLIPKNIFNDFLSSTS